MKYEVRVRPHEDEILIAVFDNFFSANNMCIKSGGYIWIDGVEAELYIIDISEENDTECLYLNFGMFGGGTRLSPKITAERFTSESWRVFCSNPTTNEFPNVRLYNPFTMEFGYISL